MNSSLILRLFAASREQVSHEAAKNAKEKRTRIRLLL